MAFSVSPSVIVREVDATAVIPAIANPPAAIVGAFRWGPVNERILVSSEQQLVERFGKPHANTEWQNYETFFTAADYLSYSNALYVTRVIKDEDESAVFTAKEDSSGVSRFAAKYPGELGNSIKIALVDTDDFSELLFGVDTLDSGNNEITDITFNSNEIVIENVTNDIVADAVVTDDVVRVGNSSVGYIDMEVVSFTKEDYLDPVDGVTTLYRYTFTFDGRYTLAELDPTKLSFTKMWGYSRFTNGAPSSNHVHIAVIDGDGKISGVAGTLLELYENVSKDPDAKLEDGTTNYYRNVIENRSAWISTYDNELLDMNGEPSPLDELSQSDVVQPLYFTLTGGSDGYGEKEANLFGAIAQGWDLYRDANEVDISAVLTGKAVNANLPNYLISNIADNRKDCVVYISPRYSDVVTPANTTTKMENSIDFRNMIQSSSYWFMDTGYKYRYDKYNDAYRWVPLNGDMAGLAARVDPWVSPAGFKRGTIKNVVKLAYNPNKTQRDLLYGSDINPVISQVGQGIILFGDKTGLGRSSAFDRINVRRLFITVEKAIATISATFLFDFNDEFTQTQFKNIVEPYLRDIQGKRGIIDFRVVSDGTVNTPDVIDRNIFRGNIYIKPARSINVIELTFVATRTGVSFDELVGQPL